MREARKALIGYSDITALLAFYLQHGLTAIHGPMIERRMSKGTEGYDEASFRQVMMSAEPVGEMRPPRLEVLRKGEAARRAGRRHADADGRAARARRGPSTSPDGCILFLEDVGERPYRIHRMLTQLEQAGMLARAGALVFGEFPGCDEPGGEPAIRDVLRDFTASFDGPVLFGFPSGHTDRPDVDAAVRRVARAWSPGNRRRS